jgi:predicted AlkP superfamily phosphohydrolase/phosphomutase
VGLNGIYLNLAGRERDGIVQPGAEAEAVLKKLAEKLKAARDPDTGKLMVGGVAVNRGDGESAPDMIIGYMPGYRSSWQTALGAVPALVAEDNTEPWRADHCIDSRFVPGVLLGNLKSRTEDPHLYDLTVSLMQQFGVGPGPGMIGKSIY